ncbi:MAG: type I asparaginase [Prevotella sp.]|nr:type I asparaginase [Prevotella sp.]
MTRILIIYTGGTIGMNVNRSTGALEPFCFDSLLERVPELRQFELDIDTRQFDPPIDSSDMTPLVWQRLVELIGQCYDSYDGFVILHGTDTMAYTASALSFMLENLTKPVILTGSQLPISQLRTDGKENLITSIEIAAARRPDGSARVPEVGIYFDGHLLRGNRTTKQSADAFNAFESFNCPHLADAGVEIVYHDQHILRPAAGRTMTAHTRLDTGVVILSLMPGLREDIVRHIVEAPSLRGIVIRSYGSGNAPSHPWLLRTLAEATEHGRVVVNISQCVEGQVAMTRYDTGLHLQQAGVLSARDSTVESAVTKLMYLLGRFTDTDDVRRYMQQSIRGEISIKPNT